MADLTGLSITVDISPGELIDKITILEIKTDRLTDPSQLENVWKELDVLAIARDTNLKPSSELNRLSDDLRHVNEELWEIEDKIRLLERDREFGEDFVALARAVYKNNDQRSRLKRQINDLLGAAFKEEKSYEDY